MLKKSALFFVLGLIGHLYTTFVLTLLWNWFATVAFHVSEASFWVMYGMVLVVSLFQNPSDKNFEDERRWNALMAVVSACVPDSQQQTVKEQLEEQKETLWIGIGTAIFGRAFGSTITLGIGFLAHLLASA